MGKVLKVGAANYGHSSSMVAEARALKDGVSLAVRAGYMKINIKGDNLVVIQALKSINRVPWKITSILEDIHTWITRGLRVTINHTFQRANMVAD